VLGADIIKAKLEKGVRQQFILQAHDLSDGLTTGNRISLLGNRNNWTVGTVATIWIDISNIISSPHCGYLVPATQIASFLRAGCRVKVLLADVCWSGITGVCKLLTITKDPWFP
jgi:hypothetical protein